MVSRHPILLSILFLCCFQTVHSECKRPIYSQSYSFTKLKTDPNCFIKNRSYLLWKQALGAFTYLESEEKGEEYLGFRAIIEVRSKKDFRNSFNYDRIRFHPNLEITSRDNSLKANGPGVVLYSKDELGVIKILVPHYFDKNQIPDSYRKSFGLFEKRINIVLQHLNTAMKVVKSQAIRNSKMVQTSLNKKKRILRKQEKLRQKRNRLRLKGKSKKLRKTQLPDRRAASNVFVKPDLSYSLSLK